MCFEYILTVLSIAGAILVAKKDHRGFYLWLISNPLWIIFDLIYKHYGQAFLFVVYTIITCYGIYEWKFKYGWVEKYKRV